MVQWLRRCQCPGTQYKTRNAGGYETSEENSFSTSVGLAWRRPRLGSDQPNGPH